MPNPAPPRSWRRGKGAVGRQGPPRCGWDSDGRGAHRPLPRRTAELEVRPARSLSSSQGRGGERRGGSVRRNTPGLRGGQAGALSRTRPVSPPGRLQLAPSAGGGGRAPRGARPSPAGRAQAARPGGWNPLLSRHVVGRVPHELASVGPLHTDWVGHLECESSSGGVGRGGECLVAQTRFLISRCGLLNLSALVGWDRHVLRGRILPLTSTGQTCHCFQTGQCHLDTVRMIRSPLGWGAEA